MECRGVRGMTAPMGGAGCGSLTSQTICQAVSGCGWANGACGGNANTYPPVNTGNCPAGYHMHTENGGFCMNDQENYSGTCYNPAGTAKITCPQATYTPGMNSCAFNQYWNGSSCVNSANIGGIGCGSPSAQTQSACMAIPGCNWFNSACSPAMMNNYQSCLAGQYWNGTVCVNSSTTAQCPAGQYWFTPPSGGTGYCKNTSNMDCTSGQYWNGTACVASSTTNNYNMTPSAGCVQAGGTWNSSTNYCQMPNAGSAGGSCSPNQWWNGTACVSNSTTTNYMDPSTGCARAGGTWNSSTSFCQMPNAGGTSCSPGQWWNGTSCQSSTTPSGSGSMMPAGGCSGGQYWNGSACVSSTTSGTTSNTYVPPANTSGTYTPPPSNTSGTYVPPPATTAPPGGNTETPPPPPATSSTPPPPPPPPATTSSTPPSAMLLCSQSGGNWTGAACDLAKNISDQKAYLSYFGKSSDSLLAQVGRAFTDLFK